MFPGCHQEVTTVILALCRLERNGTGGPGLARMPGFGRKAEEKSVAPLPKDLPGGY
jgi:hypothetical protein